MWAVLHHQQARPLDELGGAQSRSRDGRRLPPQKGGRPKKALELIVQSLRTYAYDLMKLRPIAGGPTARATLGGQPRQWKPPDILQRAQYLIDAELLVQLWCCGLRVTWQIIQCLCVHQPVPHGVRNRDYVFTQYGTR